MVAKAFVLFTGTVFFVYGLFFVYSPIYMLNTVIDGEITTASGITDIRATYGGMSAAIGIILCILAIRHSTLRLGLISAAILNCCMATTRLLGIIIDGDTNAHMYGYLVLEIAATIIAAALISSVKHSTLSSDK